MALGDRLQRWWDRVRGYEPPAVESVERPSGKRRKAPEAARPVTPVQVDEPGESLKLSVDGPPTRPGPQPRYGEAGFDPYSSTAGFGKPKGWDDVPRK